MIGSYHSFAFIFIRKGERNYKLEGGMLQGTVCKELLGYGAYGVVLQATDKDGLDHAIKLYHPQHSQNLVENSSVQDILIKLPSHPNVVRGFAIGTAKLNGQQLKTIQDLVAPDTFIHTILIAATMRRSPEFPVLKMELCGETLRDWGIVCQNIYRDKPTLRHAQYRIVVGIVDGIKFLHSQHIIHRDVKPDNILFSAKGFVLDVKIADFEISRRFPDHNNEMSSCVGTIWYRAPECYRSDYNELCDLFSVGIIMWEVLSVIPLLSKSELFEALRSDRDKSAIKYNPCFPNARNMIMSLTNPDPSKRLIHWNSPLLVADLPAAQYHIRISHVTIFKQFTTTDRTDFPVPPKATNEDVIQKKIASLSTQQKLELCEIVNADRSVIDVNLSSYHQGKFDEKLQELTDFIAAHPSVQSSNYWRQKLLIAMEREFLNVKEILLDRKEIIKSAYDNILDTVVSEYTNKTNHFLRNAAYIDDKYVQDQNGNFMLAAIDQFHRLSKEKKNVLNTYDIDEMRRQLNLKLGKVYQDTFSKLTTTWDNIKSNTSNFRKQHLEEFERDANKPPPECTQDVVAYDTWLGKEVEKHITVFEQEFLTNESRLGEREFQLFEWDIRDLRSKFFKRFNADVKQQDVIDSVSNDIPSPNPECCNTPTVGIHEVVTILSNDSILLRNCEKLYRSLNIRCADIVQSHKNFRAGLIPGYSLLSDILLKWISGNGDDATTDALTAILIKEGFRLTGATVKEKFPHPSRLVE